MTINEAAEREAFGKLLHHGYAGKYNHQHMRDAFNAGISLARAQKPTPTCGDVVEALRVITAKLDNAKKSPCILSWDDAETIKAALSAMPQQPDRRNPDKPPFPPYVCDQTDPQNRHIVHYDRRLQPELTEDETVNIIAAAICNGAWDKISTSKDVECVHLFAYWTHKSRAAYCALVTAGIIKGEPK